MHPHSSPSQTCRTTKTSHTFSFQDEIPLGPDFEHTPLSEYAPLAPVRLVKENNKYWVWEVIRCPYCGGRHRHGISGGDIPPHGDPRRSLGGRIAHCHPNEEDYVIPAESEYRLIAINGTPSRLDMETFFPMMERVKGEAPPDAIDEPGYVYIMRAGGRYKIGVSRDVESRLRSIATASPFPVSLVYAEQSPDPYGLERDIHQRLADHRVHGEWFELDTLTLSDVLAMMGDAK